MGIPAIGNISNVSPTNSPTNTTTTDSDSLPPPILDDGQGSLGPFNVQTAKAEVAPAEIDDDLPEPLPAPVPLTRFNILMDPMTRNNPYPFTVAGFTKNPVALDNLAFQIEQDKKALARLDALADWQRLDTVLEYTSALIDLENTTHPQFKIVYALGSEELAWFIQQNINHGVPSTQFVLRNSFAGHDSFVDYRLIDGKASVLHYESIDFGNMVIASCHNHTFKAVLAANPDVQYAAMALEVQKDSSNCTIFAINLAKKAARQPEILDKSHSLNLKGKISIPGCKVISKYPFGSEYDFDQLLPVEFIKHSQSRERTQEYLRFNRRNRDAPINTKDQSLQLYQANHLEEHDGKLKPASIVHKRIKYLEELHSAAAELN